MIRLALAALLAPALAFGQGTSERILSQAEADQKVRGIWAEIRPKLAGLGLGPISIVDPVPSPTSILIFSAYSKVQYGSSGAGTPMVPGESYWVIYGQVHATPKFMQDEATYGAGKWFDLAPGARALLKQTVVEGWLVDRYDRPDREKTLPIYYPTGGGEAFFHRGLVTISVYLLRAGNSVTKSYKDGYDYHDIRKQETKEIHEASTPDIEALCRRIYDIIPPSAGGDTGSASNVQLALLDPNPI